jgi:hypothetical protein
MQEGGRDVSQLFVARPGSSAFLFARIISIYFGKYRKIIYFVVAKTEADIPSTSPLQE